MFSTKAENQDIDKTRRKDIIIQIAHVIEELVTAFVLALLLVAFVIQPYIIPTGSMADTLMGAHFRLRCTQCGYRYNHGFLQENYNLPPDYIPRQYVQSPATRCPACGHDQNTRDSMYVTKGDKILAVKCLYQFFEPKRWDSIVFNAPFDPSKNYIKRLIGRPGETVAIIDGDIYINGQISRKPPKVQNELWMVVYDNDYQPARPALGRFNGHIWRQPFDVAKSEWSIDQTNQTFFLLDSPGDLEHDLVYDTRIGNDFKSTYAYNDFRRDNHMPVCSDLMVRFFAQSSGAGRIGIALSKYGTVYRAWVDSDGDMVIAKVSDGQETVLTRSDTNLSAEEKNALIKFSNVDHQLNFEVGDEKLTYDLGRSPDDAGARKTGIEPQVRIFGSGKIAISHVAIFRDIHYTTRHFLSGPEAPRATESNPLNLKDDEFFALGDNSPGSNDSRWWTTKGMLNNNKSCPAGIVPREYLIGKAIAVFWPAGYKPFDKFPFSFIPDVGRMRIIYGGSRKNP